MIQPLEFGEDPEPDLLGLDLATRLVEAFGEGAGHPFRGNQHTEGTGEFKDGQWTDGPAVALVNKLVSDSPEGVKALYADDPQDAIATDLDLNNAPTLKMIDRAREYVREKSQLELRKRGEPELLRVYRGLNRYEAAGNRTSGYTSATLSLQTARNFAKTRDTVIETYDVPIGSVAAFIPAFAHSLSFQEEEIYLHRDDLGEAVSTVTASALEFGEGPGHPFRGNQWTSGESGDSEALGKSGDPEAMRQKLAEFLVPGRLLKVGDRSKAKEELVKSISSGLVKRAGENPELLYQMNVKVFGSVAAEHMREGDNVDRIVRERAAETATQSYVDQWAETAADHDCYALALQMEVAKEFDAHSESFDVFQKERQQSITTSDDVDEEIRDERGDLLLFSPKDIIEQEGEIMRSFVHEQYEQTQQTLRAIGIGPDDTVRLYRGMELEGATSGDHEVDLNPASSWSTQPSVALDFATSQLYTPVAPFVIQMDVPARNIFSTSRTGQGSLLESEVVVLNRPGQVGTFMKPEEFANAIEDG
jgi:hypothetical protein